MKIPFPEIDAQLARDAHMYICLQNEYPMNFLKCQSSYKHLKNVKSPPYKFVEVVPDIAHSPFTRPTLVDCDKSFLMNQDIIFSKGSLHRRRRDISEELFIKLEEKIKHDDFEEIILDSEVVVRLNEMIELRM